VIFGTVHAAETSSDWTYHQNAITNPESNVSCRTIRCYLQCNAVPHTTLKQHCTFNAMPHIDTALKQHCTCNVTHSSETTLHLQCNATHWHSSKTTLHLQL